MCEIHGVALPQAVVGVATMDGNANNGFDAKFSSESTTSWFLNSVNDFSFNVKPMIVDYTASDSSYGEDLLPSALLTTPTSVNDPLKLFSSSIEHYAGMVCNPVVTSCKI